MALTTLAAWLAVHGHLEAALGVAALAAAVWEKSPLFAAAFSWQPWLLLALLVPLVRMRVPPPAPPDDQTLAHPIKTGLQWHRNQWRNPYKMALPWGACLIALVDPPIELAVALVLAYGQLLMATDTVRLYQHAAPMACIAAASVCPIEWAWVILAAHWLNPWAGDGV
jgi:hypothetical protein